MGYNDEVKELLKTKKINIGLNSAEEYQADSHGNSGIVGYYLKAKQEEPLKVDALLNQRYFYRAVTFDEARCWISAWKLYTKDDADNSAIDELEKILKEKKQGIHFASGEKYAKKYIQNNSEQGIILEFDSPDLVKRFEKIGVDRKNENGDMSYGIGFQESIAKQSTDSINDKIKEKYEKYKNCHTIEKLREWWEIEEDCSLEEKRKLLKVFYFLDVLESIRIIYVKK
jgi:hypothetical protein